MYVSLINIAVCFTYALKVTNETHKLNFFPATLYKQVMLNDKLKEEEVK